jgi:hypothetical protein
MNALEGISTDDLRERDRREALRYCYLIGWLAASGQRDDLVASLERVPTCPAATAIAADLRASEQRHRARMEEWRRQQTRRPQEREDG